MNIAAAGASVTVHGAWIETFSGKKFHLLEPQADEIEIIDIAHALSNQCRYTGHVRKFFSVAEHSYHVSLLVPKEDALAGLLHDASEAYITDLSRPIKQLTPVGPPYYEVEDRIMHVIANKYGFDWPMSKDVKNADNTMLFLEKERLMGNLSWDDDASSEEARRETVRQNCKDITLSCFSPETIEKIFLYRFDELTNR